MAKQVNTKFLIILTLAILVGIGGVLVGVKFWNRAPKPATLIAEGEKFFAEKKYSDAAAKFGHAAMLAPNQPAPVARLGDALYQISRSDPEFWRKAVGQWDAALQIDPNYVPAVQSKLDAFIEEMEATPRAETYVRVRDTAKRLTEVDPANARAASYQYIATLSAWFNNVQTPPDLIAEAIEGLKSLARGDPSDAALPYHIARALIQYGQDETRAGRQDAALARFNDAASVMDDAVNKQPANVIMLLRAGQIYSILDILVPRDISKGAYDRQCAVYLDRARALARPEDQSYREVNAVYATRKWQTGDLIEAERVYRDLMHRDPGNVAVRLELAEILQSQRESRKEAADLLAGTVAQGELPSAPKTPLARMLQFRAILRLCSIRMDLLEDVRDPTNYKELLQQIEIDVAKAESKTVENTQSLKVRGRLLLIKQDYVTAVQVLTKAAQMLDQAAAKPDYELMYSLARAHLAVHNNEDAKRLLIQIVKTLPTYLPARYLLVDLLLNSNETEEARRHIDELEKQAPDSALVVRFKLLTLDPKKDAAALDRYYGMLQEETRLQKLEKARIAIVIDKLVEGARLLEEVRAATPNDARVADRLARLYVGMNQREKAKKILEEGLRHNPKDPNLLLFKVRFENGTPEDIFEIAHTLIESTADPLMKALQMADLERLRGNGKGMWEQLTAAEKLAPNDPRVQDQLFTYYLATRQYDAAYKYIDPLAKSNYGGSYGLIYWWKFYAAKGDHAAAVRIGRDFTQKMPQFAISWITLGQSLKAKGEYEEALRNFNNALERQNTNRDAIRGAIDCLYALKRYPEARKIIASARKLFPTDLGLAEMELEYELRFGDPQNAMKPLLENLNKNPELIAHYLNAARMYYRLSVHANVTPEQARQHLEQGMSILKRAVAKFPEQIQPYMDLAELQITVKQRDAAEATLRQMVEQERLKELAEPKLVLAEFYIKGNQAEKAESVLRDALAVAPKSQEIRRKLAVYLSQNKRVNEALKLLNDAGEQAMEPMLLTSRLEILAAHGRYGEAETYVADALKDKPNDVNWLALLASAQFNLGKFDAAIATGDKVLAIDPKNSRAIIHRGMAKMRRPSGDPGDAIPDLIAYRDMNPGDSQVRVLLAEIYNRTHRPVDAMQEMAAAVRNAPTDVPIRTALLDLYRNAQPPRWTDGDQVVKDAQAIEALSSNPDWLVAESAWLVNRRQPQKAVDASRRAMTLAPEDPKYIQHHLTILLNTKNEAMLLTETDPMIAADPNRWWIHQARGLARKRLNDPKAEEEFRRAVSQALQSQDAIAVETALRNMAREIGPDQALAMILPRLEENPRYMLLASQQYLQKGDQANALKIIKQAMDQLEAASGETRSTILSYAGAVYLTVDPPMVEESFQMYKRLVGQEPENVNALNQMAWILAEQMSPPRYEEALVYSTKAYDLVDRSGRFSPTIADTHGWVLVLCGKLDDGISVLQKVVERHKTAETHYHLGQAYLKQGKTAEAIAQFDSAQELMKTNDLDKVPVDPALRQKVRQASEKANTKTP